MDLRVLVLTGDRELGEIVRSQVENLGCRTTMAGTYDECRSSLEWTEAAVVDAAGGGLDDLDRLRRHSPLIPVLTIVEDEVQEVKAQAAGTWRVLREPFSIAEITDAVRSMGTSIEPDVIDLTTGERHGTRPGDDAPWWATR